MPSLFLGSPPGQRWPVSIETVESNLRTLDPAIVLARFQSPVTGAATIDFDMHFPDGQVRSGAYSDDGTLVMNDGSPADWAPTAASILQLLPPGAPIYAMVENGDPVPAHLPQGTQGAEAIAAFFESLGA